jgi:hypothetical protein
LRECRAKARHGVCVGGVLKLHDFLSPPTSFSQHPSNGNAMQVVIDGANINNQLNDEPPCCHVKVGQQGFV